MSTFIATLGPKKTYNWEICKREQLWGVVGRGSNWRKNASRLKAGDRVFVWRGGERKGFIAEIEALGPLKFSDEPGVTVPWPEPEWFGGVFPMRVRREVDPPITDHFPNANGRVGLRFGFNNTALQHIFEEISSEVASRIEAAFAAVVPSSTPVGVPHAPGPLPSPISKAEPFEVDPDLVDRGIAAHHTTVTALANWVRAQGHTPLVPAPGDPLFDLAWLSGGVLNVAEVKSTTSANEESQLRLGLGQVLRYRQQLSAPGREVVAWLVPEREPSDPTWTQVCVGAGVHLSWPALWREPTIRI